MAYGLPTRGQLDYDDELNNSIADAHGKAEAAQAEALAARNDASYARQRADQAAAPTAEAIAAEVADPTSLTSVELSSTYARGINVESFGEFTEASDYATNAATLQAANDAVHAAGGGRVILPPGVFDCKGVVQDSRVELFGPGCTLNNPDGTLPSVIESRIFTTTGTIATADTILTVASPDDLEPGQVISVHGAGGLLDTQFTTITGAIDSTQTTGIALAATTGFGSVGTLRVGTELISHTGISGSSLTGVTRGVLGTAPAAHVAGDDIGTACVLYARVVSVAGTNVTLDTAADLGVTAATVTAGVVAPAISHLRIVGNRVVGGAAAGSMYGVKWDMAADGVINDLAISGCEGGLMLDRGAAGCEIFTLTIDSCGTPEDIAGSALWFFRGASDNHVSGLRITGDCYLAICMDDRTTIATPWDASADNNHVSGLWIDVPNYGQPAIDVAGCNRNYIGGGAIRGANIGMRLLNGSQGVAADGSVAPCEANELASLRVRCNNPWSLFASGNTLHDCSFSDAGASPTNPGGNLVYGSQTAVGGGIVLGGGIDDTAFLNFPSIPAHSTAELTATVTGARVGDNATAHPNAMPPAGLVWSAVVTATDTVTVRAGNVTTAAIDPSNATWRIHIQRP